MYFVGFEFYYIFFKMVCVYIVYFLDKRELIYMKYYVSQIFIDMYKL